MAKITGGKKYGEGFHGATYDLSCKLDDNETLCRMLKDRRVKSIQLHSFEKMIALEKKSEIRRFIKYIHNLEGCVAKVFTQYMFGAAVSGFSGFHGELENMKTIYEIFGERTEKETTLTSMKLYGFNFVAAYIVFEDNTNIYTTFTSKCTSDLFHTKFNESMYKSLIKDILRTLVVMQKRNFAHCDIKPDNMIYCKKLGRFKIIDWGLSGFLKPGINFAPIMFTAPLVKYLSGFPAVIATRLMYYSAWKNNQDWFQSAIFQELYKFIIEDFNWVLDGVSGSGSGDGGVDELHEKYKYKFDLFNFGMSLAYIVYANKLKWGGKTRDFVLRCICFKSGFKSAEEAMDAM